MNIKLHSDSFYISPYGFSCWVALREKEIPFEYVSVSLSDKEQRNPAYRERSITGKVPMLEHDGFCLAESSAIIEYVEELFAPPEHPRLLPSDSRQRARARQIMAWIRSDLMPIREERSTTTMFYERANKPLSPAGRAAAENLIRVAELVLPQGETSLFGGFTIADADLAFMLHRLILNGDDVPARLRAFAEAQWKRPSVRSFVEQKRKPYVPY
jgi:glutathione S-transferase